MDTKASTCWIHGSQQNDCHTDVAVKLRQHKCTVLGKLIFHGCARSKGKSSFITSPTYRSVDDTVRILTMIAMLILHGHSRLQLLWQRAAVDRFPLQIVSMVSFGVSALCAIIFFLPSSAHGDKMRDHESYI